MRPWSGITPTKNKNPRHGGGSIDKSKNFGYSNSTRALPVDGSPCGSYKEVTVIWGDLAVTSLFLSICLTRAISATTNIQKAKSSVHVIIATTPSLLTGGVRSSPPKRGNRLPRHGSATNRITHISAIGNPSAPNYPFSGSRKVLLQQQQTVSVPSVTGFCSYHTPEGKDKGELKKF